MRKLVALLIGGLLLCSMAYAVSSIEANYQNIKTYLPGDVVSVIVGAPPDTNGIIAQMPNGTEIELTYDRRNYVWRGFWEVPMRTPKGIYTAKLIASDIEGKKFRGETAPFIIGEPTLITLIDMVSSTVEVKKQVRETIEGPIYKEEKVPKEEAPIVEVQKKIKPVVPVIKHKKIVAVKPAVPKPVKVQESQTQYIIAARYYLAKQDYSNAKKQLNQLLKIDPTNDQVRSMLKRMDTLEKTKGTGK